VNSRSKKTAAEVSGTNFNGSGLLRRLRIHTKLSPQIKTVTVKHEWGGMHVWPRKSLALE
jgi:hypothetical protein